ncbi:peptidase inhibitor family I36 protein [Kitasatospora cathayae]|uniref:peptidase inhibitor family I36 protein n=1 Tax=Kitasatospora cathayae TaxID=3004092 RepID=UPI0038601CAD
MSHRGLPKTDVRERTAPCQWFEADVPTLIGAEHSVPSWASPGSAATDRWRTGDHTRPSIASHRAPASAVPCGSGNFCVWTDANFTGLKIEHSGDDHWWEDDMFKHDSSWANRGISGPGVKDHVKVYERRELLGRATICLAPGQEVGTPGSASPVEVGGMRETRMSSKRAASRLFRLTTVLVLIASALLSVAGPACAAAPVDPLLGPLRPGPGPGSGPGPWVLVPGLWLGAGRGCVP